MAERGREPQSLGRWRAGRAAALAALILACWGVSDPARAAGVNRALCGLITASAKRYDLPVAFLTRLIFIESSFRPAAVSSAGAQGIAQFMPGTASQRGLADPFDPQQAIPKSAQLLADLTKRFGNLGLAAAAYNAGPARIAAWLRRSARMPAETRAYVRTLTGHGVGDWARAARQASEKKAKPNPPAASPARPRRTANCTTALAALELTSAAPQQVGSTGAPPPIFEPWGVQLAGAFNKALALAEYRRRIARYRKAVGEARPMIIGTRLESRGSQPFYRIRIPEPTRAAADAQCRKIRAIGGACVVLRS